MGQRPAGCERQRSRRWEPQPGQWHCEAMTERLSPAVAYGQALLRTTSQSASQTAPLVGEPLAKPFTLRGLPKPPLGRGGGTASAVTERLSPEAAHGQALLRTTSQSRFARQGRVAAPSVCFAAARILLAAAPTAPPCFRHWRRSSPLPLVGEPLAKRRSFPPCQSLPSVGEVARRQP